MIKKIGIFFFALGVGISAAFAGEEECYAACDAAMDACLEAGTSGAGCVHQWDMCYARCVRP
jgi:hypothetical protein